MARSTSHTRVMGEGALGMLSIWSWVHHVEMAWEISEHAHFLRRLASFGRLVNFDRRGTGLSDPVATDNLPDLETQVEDALAVLDAARLDRAAVLGIGDGGLVAMLLAATHPERCGALVLFGTGAKRTQASDYPWGVPEDHVESLVQSLAETWATGGMDSQVWLSPSRAGDERFLQQMLRFGRAAVRPGAVAHYFRQVMNTDLRGILPAIQAPTLVMQRVGDKVCPVEHGRYLARHIEGAKYVELPGADHGPYSEDPDVVIDEIEEFLTGARSGGESDRVLATLLFTDIVGSTTKAAQLGDRRWKDLLDAHDAAVRREIGRFRGREIVTTGDGFLAVFDGPARAIRCAKSIVDAVARLGLEVRAGVHAGECEVRGENIGGLAVHIGARVAGAASPGQVLVSSTVKDLVAGSGIEFEDFGEHELKGVPGTRRMFAATHP